MTRCLMASSSFPNASACSGVRATDAFFTAAFSSDFFMLVPCFQRLISTSPTGTETQIWMSSSSEVEMDPVVMLRTAPPACGGCRCSDSIRHPLWGFNPRRLGLIENRPAVVVDGDVAFAESDSRAGRAIRHHEWFRYKAFGHDRGIGMSTDD